MRSDGAAILSTDRLSDEPVVGTVVEPDDEVGEFVFATPDEQAVSTGEFVAYSQCVAGSEDDEIILARVNNRERVSGLPTSFMADPDVDADQVATTLGAEADGCELYRITASVIGYYDPGFESFRNPRQLPSSGTRLYRAPGEMLEVVIPNVNPPAYRDNDAPDPGIARMGRLLNRADEEVAVELPVNEIAATHLAILASTGSGKSYTASVLLEEMLKPDTRGSVLVFDPHGEYKSLDQMCDHEAFRSDGYQPAVELRRSDQLSVKLADLTFDDFYSILEPTQRMSSVLNDALDDLQNEESFTASQLVSACHSNHPDGQADGLKWRINRHIMQSDFFDAYDRLDLDDLVNPGQVTVFQMGGLTRRDQQVMAAVLLRKLYAAREAAVVGDPDDVRSEIKHPVFTLFEEAHRFAPDGDSQALPIIRQVNSEGRKFGLGTGLISQRPSKLDETVLSQCGTQITMNITNPNDQQAIRDSIENAGEAVLEELPGLTKGQAIISGDAVNTPVLAKIRNRHTDHKADSLSADQLWREAYDDAKRAPSTSKPARSDEGGVLDGEEEI